MRLIFLIIYIIVLGILSHVIGERLPRAWFDPKARPYLAYGWEQGGRIYERLNVRKWKDHVPDMSRLTKDMVRKRVSLNSESADVMRVARETCVAEVVHWALLLFAVVPCFFCKTALEYIVAIIYGLSNLPFIIVQRYNRPKLVAISERLKLREARKKACES